MRIDQPHAIEKLVIGSGADVSIPKFTPLPPSTEVMLNDCPDLTTVDGLADAAYMKSKPYRKRVGEALWIARTSRPDIQPAVAKLSTVCNNPGPRHSELTDYLMQYLRHTRHLGLLYTEGGSTYPYGFVDAAFRLITETMMMIIDRLKVGCLRTRVPRLLGVLVSRKICVCPPVKQSIMV